jgi:hypothetical protein
MRTLAQTDIRVAQAPGEGWADQLAHLRCPKPEVHETPSGILLLKAVAELWGVFDKAALQVNEALERSGVDERCLLHHAHNERTYRLAGPDGTERTISISVNMRMANGRMFGGVCIGNSQTRLSMALIPTPVGGSILWQVTSMGKPFDDDLVHDLFLSVFGDDPMATARLSPLSGFDAFETPWS